MAAYHFSIKLPLKLGQNQLSNVALFLDIPLISFLFSQEMS